MTTFDRSVTAFIKQKYIERLWISLSASTTTDSAKPLSQEAICVAVTEPSKSTDMLSGVLKAVGL